MSTIGPRLVATHEHPITDLLDTASGVAAPHISPIFGPDGHWVWRWSAELLTAQEVLGCLRGGGIGDGFCETHLQDGHEPLRWPCTEALEVADILTVLTDRVACEMDVLREKAYQAGHRRGYEKAFPRGREEVYDRGYNDGHADGVAGITRTESAGSSGEDDF